MKLTAVTSITNNIVAARFWMAIALICGALAVTSPYLTIKAMKQKEKVVILDQGGTLIYSPQELSFHVKNRVAFSGMNLTPPPGWSLT